MKKLKSKTLLLLIALIGMIQLSGQTDSVSKICLTFPEFDFYAGRVVEYNGLVSDTASFREMIRTYGQITQQQSKALSEAKKIILNRDTVIRINQVAFNDILKKYVKSEKRSKIKDKVIYGLSISSLLLGAFAFSR